MRTVTARFTDDCPADWNGKIAALSGASILQTAEWGALKGAHGWTPRWGVWADSTGAVVAAALILRKKLFGPFEFRYVPRGPLFDVSDAGLTERVLADLEADARRGGAVFLKIDRDVPIGFGVPGDPGYREDADGLRWVSALKARGYRFSDSQIQFANSIWIDLTPELETLSANLKQRTRYKARLALKKGVTIRGGNADDFGMMYALYRETAARDGFIIREEGYYRDVWSRFFAAGMLRPLIAEVDGEAAGAIMLFIFAGKAWYIYGMSSGDHREKMPNYALQWEAIRTAKEAGAEIYDLWGAPDAFDPSDRMWGVYQFKRGLGGYEVISPGAYDLPLRRLLFRLYGPALRLLTEVRRRLYRARQGSSKRDGAPGRDGETEGGA